MAADDEVATQVAAAVRALARERGECDAAVADVRAATAGPPVRRRPQAIP
jgi:hypothetical protein